MSLIARERKVRVSEGSLSLWRAAQRTTADGVNDRRQIEVILTLVSAKS